LEDQRSCVTSDGGINSTKIKVKEEPAEHLTSMDCSNNETSNQACVKVENNHSYESEGMEPKGESHTFREIFEANTTGHINVPTVESPELRLQGNEYGYSAFIKPHMTHCNEMELQSGYSVEDNNMTPHFLVFEEKSFKNPQNSSCLSFKCPLCCCPFTYRGSYDEHRKICNKKLLQKQNRQGNGMMCRICKVEFETQVALISHKNLHRKSNIRLKDVTFVCHTCNIMFQQKGELICHQAQYHREQVNKNVAQQKVFSCDKCRISFVHKVEYILHKEFHHNASPLTCRLPIYRKVVQAAELISHG
jgi:hypothetical protein